jgi:hypothetical protein
LLIACTTHRSRDKTMHSDPSNLANDPAAELPAFGSFATPAGDAASAASEPAPTPVGLLTLGIAWLFGLEALLGDDRRPTRR